MQRIKLKRRGYHYIESRKYDWGELDELIARGELIEVECPTPEEARGAYLTLRKSKASADGAFTVTKDGCRLIVDATGGDRDDAQG